jgi:microcystin-dependent protein
MTVVDNYFPFDTGPGAAATPARWRLMARQWSSPGVIPNYNNQCRPSLVGTALTIDTGGIWIDGFYGENQTSKTLSVVGGDGLVVARADPNGRQIVFSYNIGATQPVQTLTNIYEVSIARITAGAMVDIRQFANGGTPSGIIQDFAGATAPGGWLLCDGTSYLKTDFPTLSSAIGIAWGGDASHFNVPDMRGRVPVGSGFASGLSNRLLAAAGGEEQHLLSYLENGWHGHGSWTSTEYANTAGAAGWHQHGVYMQYLNVVYYPGSSITGVGGSGWPIIGLGSPGGIVIQNQTALHQHIIPGEGGNPHNNMQPFVVVTKIIKT